MSRATDRRIKALEDQRSQSTKGAFETVIRELSDSALHDLVALWKDFESGAISEEERENRNLEILISDARSPETLERWKTLLEIA